MAKIVLPESEEKLLEQCEVETFRASGKGGQHVNKTNSAVRLRHLPTGITVTAQEERSQYRNKLICLEKIREQVARLNYRAPKRVRTRKPLGAQKREMKAKQMISEKKKLRGKPPSD